MVIATSGVGASISFNRIISSTSSYSVDTEKSKTYRDTTLSTFEQLRGLFIVDQDNLVALIDDTSSTITNVATLNLATPSVFY